ncbi:MULTISPECIES: hypothetical protein [Shewanella]|uniref:hypothetical protein n=2 Tax=Shewanellaceae TaxID=267890 RepID=UPI0007EEBA48|nr:hypothetical protein [Shewanella japonica]OBT06975.1 hypothetical protein A9267_13930 [Shewanella sp. UCD-FRSSP16_17]
MAKSLRLTLLISVIALAGITMTTLSHAGKVVVRKSSEPFDAFAVRDAVQQDHQWQEMLRMQQQIQILQALPLGCLAVAVPYHYYNCAGSMYRPYMHQNQELFIQIDPPKIPQVK